MRRIAIDLILDLPLRLLAFPVELSLIPFSFEPCIVGHLRPSTFILTDGLIGFASRPVYLALHNGLQFISLLYLRRHRGVPVNTVPWQFDAEAYILQFWLNDNELSEIQVMGSGDGCLNTETQNGEWWGPKSFGAIRLGIEQYAPTSLSRTMYIDDVAIDDRYVSCPDAISTSSSSSSSTSSSSSSSSTSSSGGDLPTSGTGVLANGLCAANTGLGSGSATYGVSYVVLQDGTAVSVKGGVAKPINYDNGSPVTDAIAISNGSYSNTFCLARASGSMHCGSGETVSAAAAYTPSSLSKAIISLSVKNIGGGVCAL